MWTSLRGHYSTYHNNPMRGSTVIIPEKVTNTERLGHLLRVVKPINGRTGI